LYNPNTHRWQFTRSMHGPREEQTATLLDNGDVLVAGGYGCAPFEVCRSAELYNPRTGRWSYTSPMHEARAGQTATLLRDGQVLVVGGYSCNATSCGHLASAELYSPTLRTWRSAGNMAAAREYQTGTRLRNGAILIAGGTSECPPAKLCAALASTEVYSPGETPLSSRKLPGSSPMLRLPAPDRNPELAACRTPAFHSGGIPNRPGTPWVRVGPKASAVDGFFFMASRLYHTNGDIRDDNTTKAIWFGPNGSYRSSTTGYDLSLGAHPTPVDVGNGIQDFPRPGCWRLEFRQGSGNIVRSATFLVLGD
jgi:hypothetical protein